MPLEPSRPSPADPLDELRSMLARRPRELPARYFYDERGSRLFERITSLPEYYLTRAERLLLRDPAVRWVRELGPRALLELGAGSAEKTRLILDAMSAGEDHAVYLPVDVSASFLEQTTSALRREYPTLTVRPVVADITRPITLDGALPHPLLAAFLGSTLGNFDDDTASALLAGVASLLETDDRLMLGADLVKDVTRLEAAYNDADGVTAAFNLNMLAVLNRRFGADFDAAAFRHVARWDPESSRMEMLLVSQRQQEIRIPGLAPVALDAGEPLRTEISTKYDRPRLDRILDAAGLVITRWASHADDPYALLLAARSR